MYNVYVLYGTNIHLSTLVVETVLWILIISTLFLFRSRNVCNSTGKEKKLHFGISVSCSTKFARTVIENVYKHHLTLLWNALQILAINRLNILLFCSI